MLVGISRQGFNRQNNKGNNQQNKTNGQQSTSPTSYQSPPSSLAPSMPPMAQSPALSPAMMDPANSENQQSVNRKQPFFFRDEYSGLIVKGNLTTLAVKPVHVEDGEWLAHQGKRGLSVDGRTADTANSGRTEQTA